jgi:hypothetical protein
VAPEDYAVGQHVKCYVGGEISPYVGVVLAILPEIYKVLVAFPIGDPVKMSPEDLIIVPPTVGLSAVHRDNGMDSYEKSRSAENFGTIPEKGVAKNLVKAFGDFVDMIGKKASEETGARDKVQDTFAEKAASTVIDQITVLKSAGKTQLEAYASVCDAMGASLPDAAVRNAVAQIYNIG